VDWDQADLDYFGKQCKIDNVKVDKQIGANSETKCKIPLVGFQTCAEALLDIQYAKAVIRDLPLTNIMNQQYSLLSWAQQVDNLGDAGPAVHSVSYGNDEVQQTSTAFMESVNAQLMKLGARGVTVVFASGDQGTCGRSGCSGSSPKFNPDFPASSPYVTAVGGTDFATAGAIGDEKAWTGGGGGFSNTFPVPSWQKTAVQNYLKTAKGLPAASQFNASGRAYPDVAALAGQQNPYCVAGHMFIGSKMTGIAGTSAACPVFAGIVTRLNAELQAKGKAPLGLLNPWLYAHPEMFNDVTIGSNNAGGGGFPTASGWDAATGLGTPDYAKMLTAALAAQGAEIVV